MGRCVVISIHPLSNAMYSWGPSAGGLSVGSHLVANGGNNEGLFRAAVLSCGFLLPTGDISFQQPFFDSIAAYSGCAGARDKLGCLRGIPAENLTAAAASLPSFFGYKVRFCFSIFQLYVRDASAWVDLVLCGNRACLLRSGTPMQTGRSSESPSVTRSLPAGSLTSHLLLVSRSPCMCVRHLTFVTGDSLYEGTIFASGAWNITYAVRFIGPSLAFESHH